MKLDSSSDSTKEGKPPALRDYVIPRKDQRLAILRLEFPISAEDVDQIGKWLELMKATIAE